MVAQPHKQQPWKSTLFRAESDALATLAAAEDGSLAAMEDRLCTRGSGHVYSVSTVRSRGVVGVCKESLSGFHRLSGQGC